MFYCLGVQLYHLCGKRRFVCAHIGQNRHIYPPSINRLPFDSRHPPPFAQVDGGGCYREKFFYFFSILVWILVSTLFFRLSYLIILTRLKFVILYSILFFGISIVSTRYKFCSILSRLQFMTSLLIFDSYFNFLDSFLLVEFSSHQFRLVSALSILCSLTLLLVISKHLCLCEFVLCLFWLF